MKASLKLRGRRQILAIITGLTLTVSLGARADTSPAPAKTAPSPASSTTLAPEASSTEGVAQPGEFSSWLTVGAGGAFVSGDNGQYKHEHNTNSGAFGGVQDFHWQRFVGKTGTFEVDGHGIFGNHDYDLKLDLTDPNLGYVRGGYTEYRTWYDGTGGYYPLNNLSFAPTNNELYIDRRNAWVEAGLTLPDMPAFDVRYEFDSRKGLMDSTSWGQTTLTPTGVQAKINPSYMGINETRNIVQADMKDKIGNTDAALGIRYEIDRTSDSSYLDQNPGQPALNAFITENDVEKDQMFNAHGSTATYFDKKVTLSSGFSVTKIDTDISGSRVYGNSYDAPINPKFANNGAGFTNMAGGGVSKDYVGNLNLMLTPIANLVVVPSARVEYEDSNLSDGFSSISGVGPKFVSTPEVAKTYDWSLGVVESLETRYTGFRDWSLYASTEISEDWGNDNWGSSPILNTVNFQQDWNRLGQKYTIGANWYPLSQLNFGSQYYHEIHDYTFDNNANTSAVQYPGYLQSQVFTTDDMNFRATWQALSNVSLITRYDFQYSTVDTTSNPTSNGAASGVTPANQIESVNFINHILSEDVTWTPIPCLYVQAGGSYVINSLDTGTPVGSNNLILNGENNYWTIDASAGYEINPKTHLQLQYSFYNADDYQNTTPYSQPFGAGDVQHSITATLSRQITKQMQVSVKYGFYRNRDATSGGQDNYDAQLVYASTEFQF